MKKAVAALLALVMMVALIPIARADGGLENFAKTAEYVDGQFTDVAGDVWYAPSVKAGYEYGLMKGTSASTFNPGGNITLAEAITLAARLHSIYTSGEASFEQGDPWYQVYIDYTVENAIIGEEEYPDYSAIATRAQFAKIFAAAFPEAALEKINNIEIGAIPDVAGDEPYGEAVYRLYNAGILTGNDVYGTFSPESNITRAEVAAIATRMADTGLRRTVELQKKEVPAERIEFKEKEITLYGGESIQLEIVAYPEGASVGDMWFSSDLGEKLQITKEGVATANRIFGDYPPGEIVCHAGDLTASCKITLKQAFYITYNGEKLANLNLYMIRKLRPGDTMQLGVRFADGFTGSRNVTWVSSAPEIASVSQSGLISIHDVANMWNEVQFEVTADNGEVNRAYYCYYVGYEWDIINQFNDNVLKPFGNTVDYLGKCLDSINAGKHTSALMYTALASGQLQAAIDGCGNNQYLQSAANNLAAARASLQRLSVYSTGSAAVSYEILNVLDDVYPYLMRVCKTINNEACLLIDDSATPYVYISLKNANLYIDK